MVAKAAVPNAGNSWRKLLVNADALGSSARGTKLIVRVTAGTNINALLTPRTIRMIISSRSVVVRSMLANSRVANPAPRIPGIN